MPDIYAGSPGAVIRAFHSVLTTTFEDGGVVQSGLAHAVAAVNAAAAAAGLAQRLSAPVGVEVVLQDDGLHDPADCPHLRLVAGESLQLQLQPAGGGSSLNQGVGTMVVPVVTYLTQTSAAAGETLETSLALQVVDWVQALIYCIRRKPAPGDTARGVWAYTACITQGPDLLPVSTGTYALEADHRARSARVVTQWQLRYDAFY